MTRDPVGPPPLFARRVVQNERIIYTIWSEECSATVIIDRPEVDDEQSRLFLSYVISADFAKSMMLEFDMADLVNRKEEK